MRLCVVCLYNGGEKMQGIPKIIHCCWFGNGKKPKIVEECIKTWSIFMPEYRIIEWNESNFSVSEAPIYVQESYEKKKYAFVSDYVRLYALEQYGGVYFDTDIEVCKNFDDILDKYQAVVGFQDPKHLMTGFMACVPHYDLIQAFLRHYDSLRFIMPDGTMNVTANPTMFTELFHTMKGMEINGEKQILPGKIAVFPRVYFSAFDLDNDYEIVTTETCTIHHYTGSWNDATLRKKKIKRSLVKLMGPKAYVALKKFVKSFIIR